MTQNTKTTFPRTIGMDLGVRSTSFCSVDQSGSILDEGVLTSAKEEMGALFKNEPTSRVVIEASGPSRWVAALAAEHGHEVVVANPREFKLISQSHRKTDRNDARILADFGQFRPKLQKPVKLRGLKCQIARTTLTARSHVVRQRTLVINLIRAQVRNLGESLPTCGAAYFSKKSKDLIPAVLRTSLDPRWVSR